MAFWCFQPRDHARHRYDVLSEKWRKIKLNLITSESIVVRHTHEAHTVTPADMYEQKAIDKHTHTYTTNTPESIYKFRCRSYRQMHIHWTTQTRAYANIGWWNILPLLWLRNTTTHQQIQNTPGSQSKAYQDIRSTHEHIIRMSVYLYVVRAGNWLGYGDSGGSRSSTCVYLNHLWGHRHTLALTHSSILNSNILKARGLDENVRNVILAYYGKFLSSLEVLFT